MNVTEDVTWEERISLELTRLYRSRGYTEFRMRKFEEYALYFENKNFLRSGDVLTFTDREGKLLALKPDVTLSIIKNTKASPDNPEKYYYREKVYRLEKHSREFREITQIGLENIAVPDGVGEAETVLLALKTLETVDRESVLVLSHMGIAEGILDLLGAGEGEVRERLLEALRAKNAHDFSRILAQRGLSEERIAAAVGLLRKGSFEEQLTRLGTFSTSEEVAGAVSELKQLLGILRKCGYGNRVRLDLSLTNDLDYYNGVIFQGYVRRAPHPVLSGGRYDRLAAKFAPGIGSIGFAMYLSELTAYYGTGPEEADCLLLYGEEDDPYEVLKRAEELRAGGRSVRVEQKVPAGFRAAETVRFGG